MKSLKNKNKKQITKNSGGNLVLTVKGCGYGQCLSQKEKMVNLFWNVSLD